MQNLSIVFCLINLVYPTQKDVPTTITISYNCNFLPIQII